MFLMTYGAAKKYLLSLDNAVELLSPDIANAVRS